MASIRARGRLRPLASVVLVGWAAYHVLEALELRRRRGLIAPLPPPPMDLVASGAKVDVAAVEGSTVDDRSLIAGVHAMDVSGLEVLDLLPGDLAVEPTLRFLRRVNPRQLSEDAFYAPGGVHEAVLLNPSVTERLGTVSGLRDRDALARLTKRAQRYAPRMAGIRVAPTLPAGPRSPLDRWREVEALAEFGDPYVHLAPAFAAAEAAQLLGLAAGVLVAPVPGALALAAWCLKPVVVFAGAGAVAPPGVGPAAVLRLPRAAATSAATLWAGHRATTEDRRTRRPPGAQIASPPNDCFETRRASCPWCAATDLTGHVDVGDLFQQKPGRFQLDRCGSCGHVFQNPALTPVGLTYYYDGFYAGSGESMADALFASLERNDRHRIDAMAAFAEPSRWLDVGTGHGHFCARARERWPAARFDGVDMGESVEEGARRGFLDTAHRGTFVELAPELPSYDVVSMHHYLEHTPDPRRELAAVAEVLAPGGHLMIEVPDPECPWAERLGHWWYAWSQPQHLNFVPCANLVADLESRGFDVLSVERGPATLSGDLLGAVVFGIQSVSRSPHLPWRPRPPRFKRVIRGVVVSAAMPVVVAATVADRLKDANPRPDRIGNAYRVIARKRPE